jgi:hypothetical protein
LDNCTGDVVIEYLGQSVVEKKSLAHAGLRFREFGLLQTSVETEASALRLSPSLILLLLYSHLFLLTQLTSVMRKSFTKTLLLLTTVKYLLCTVEVILHPGECPQEYTIIRTFYATDGCDNVATAQQTITVVDTTAPVFDPFTVYVYVECDDLDVAILTATDNCGEVDRYILKINSSLVVAWVYW